LISSETKRTGLSRVVQINLKVENGVNKRMLHGRSGFMGNRKLIRHHIMLSETIGICDA